MAASNSDRRADPLDPRRFLKVVAHEHAGVSFGSGYLLSPGLALTATHVVGEALRIEVRSPASEWQAAEVLWCGGLPGGPDLAVLRLVDEVDPLLPIPIGSLSTETVGFTTVGFPLAQAKNTDGSTLRDSEQVVGFLTPLTGLESGMLTLHAATTAPSPLMDGRSPWAGMSGAAVIVKRVVVGVVVHDPSAFGRDRLVAQPVASLVEEGPAREAWAMLAGAGVNLTTIEATPEREPSDRWTTGEGGAGGGTAEDGEFVVGERISTAVDVFTDRTELRARLRQTVIDRGVSVVAVFGRRGIGKTSLVAKVMADLEQDHNAGVRGICYISTRTGNNRLDLSRILHDAARLLPAAKRQLVEGIIESSGHSPGERCSYVLEELSDRGWVLVLDDLDPLQDSRGEVKDQDLLIFLECLGRAVSPPLVILTSRLPPLLPPSLLTLRIMALEMEEGIPAKEGAALLVRLDALGQAGMAQLDDATRSELVESVHGIPRALELLVALRARNPLLPADQVVRRLHSTPAVLDELVATTYSQLPAEQLAIVRVVAAIGTPSAAEDVLTVCESVSAGCTSADALNDLAATRVLGLDTATGRVRLHPLDSESILDSLPGEGPWAIRSLSASIANWYAQQAKPPDQWQSAKDVAPVLAEGFQRIRAGETDRAADLALALARTTLRVGEGWSVLGLLDSLTERVQSSSQGGRHALAMAYVRHMVGPNAVAIEAAERAQAAFARTGQPLLRAESLSIGGDALRSAGRFQEAIEHAEAALQLLDGISVTSRGESWSEGHALSLFRLGLAQVYAGTSSVRTATELTEAGRAESSLSTLAMSADLESLYHLSSGAPAEALATAYRGVELYAQSGLEPANATYVLNVAGVAHLVLGQPGQALDALARGLDMATTLRIPRAEGFNAFNLTWALVLTGQAAAAADAAAQAAQAFIRDGGQEVHVARLLETCLSEVDKGETDAALRSLDGVLSRSGVNPELYRPSTEALEAIRALIRAGSEVPAEHP